MRRSWITLALLLLAACGDDEAKTSDASSSNSLADGGVSVEHDAGAPSDTASDGSAASDQADAEALIPLILWVDDLIDHHTNESSPPDTVEDKRIAPTEDPTLFDKYFK